MRAADWLFRQARSLLVCALMLIAAGVFAAMRLPVTLFPQIDFPRISVAIDSGDRPAERMLTEVAIPVEESLRAVPGVRSIRSKTTRGSAEFSVNFAWDHDMVAALLQVQAALASQVSNLPAGTQFVARRMDPTVFPVLGYSVVSDRRSPVELRDIAFHTIRPVLASIDGVARTDVAGGQLEEVHVEIDPARLAAHGLTVQDINTALAGTNIVQATGRLEDHLKLYLVMVSTPLASAADIENVVVRAGPGGAVYLKDVADVSSAAVPSWTRVTADGHDAVLIQVYQQPDGNTVRLARDATAKLAELTPTLPADVKISTWYDQSELVRASANGLLEAVLIGTGLAALVLLVFLRNIRITLIAVVTVPGVLAVTCLLLLAFRQTLNIMTLGGMAAAVGLIIDDAIVMVEHVVARVRGGSERGTWSRRFVLDVAGEFTRPLLGASLATIIIHVPPAFLSGVTGEFFKALSLTIAVSLVVSFIVAWALVPLFSSFLLSAHDSKKSERTPSIFARTYAGTLRVTLRRAWIVVLPIAALAFAGWWAYPRLKNGFMPAMDEGGFVLDYKTPAGTSLAETDRILRRIEDILRATPEVQTYSRRTGLQLGGGLTEANEGDFFVRLKPLPRDDIEDVMKSVRDRVIADAPAFDDEASGFHIEMIQLMEDLIGDLTAVPQPIEIKLYSEDQKVLDEIAPKVAAELGKLSKSAGLADINDGRNIAGDALEIQVDPLKAGIEGLDANAVAATVQQMLLGSVATTYQVFGDTPKVVGVRVWSIPRLRKIEDDLERIRMTAPDGHTVPLSRVATIKRAVGQPQIQREDLRRMTAVTARTEGVDLGTAIAKVKEVLKQPGLLVPAARPDGTTPAAPRFALGGLYQEQQTAFAGLLAVFAAAVVLVFVLLVYWYESLRVALCLIVTSLLALPGVALGLWLTDIELNISSMMGLAMIVGSVTEVGIFLCSELLHPIEASGGDARTRVIAAALRRVRPITMTTIAATLAMLPLVIGVGEGAAMLRPLATAIVAGLIVQLPLTLLVLPGLLIVSGAVRE
ncbi:MAG: efflux RND transporter permease subunit [Phycisphaerales bacterium]